MNPIDDYFESIKPLLSELDIIEIDHLINLLNKIDNDVMPIKEKINVIDKFVHFTGDEEQVTAQRNIEMVNLTSLVPASKGVKCSNV